MATFRSQRRPRQGPAVPSSLVIRNIVVSGRRTSVRLEPVMWDALREIARQQQRTLHQIATDIDRDREESTLTAAIRVYIVRFYRAAAGGTVGQAGIAPAQLLPM